MANKQKKDASSLSSLRTLSIEELKKDLLESTKDQFKLRMQKVVRQLEKIHLLKQTRRRIAQIKTLLSEKNVKK